MRERVILLPTYEQALSYRKNLARSASEAAFGVRVLTHQDWLKDAWERWGDGRQLITPLQRALAVSRLADEYGHTLTDGVRTLVSHFFADALGTEELEQALIAPPDTLSDQERFVLSLVEPYRALVARHGFIEPGDAYTVFAHTDCDVEFEQPVAFDLPRAFEHFCAAYAVLCRSYEQEVVRVSPLADHAQPAFLFAAGPSAQNALIVHDVLSRFQGEDPAKRILIVSAQPRTLYYDFARATKALASQARATQRATNAVASQAQAVGASVAQAQAVGASVAQAQEITCCLRTSVPFFQTDFGRSYQALVDFLLDPHHETKAFLDYIHSAYAGIRPVQDLKKPAHENTDPYRVRQIDATVRGNRLLSFEDLCALARLTSRHFDAFEELVSDVDASVLLDYFEEVTDELKGYDEAYKAEQLKAIAGLRQTYEQARVWGVTSGEVQSILSALSIKVSCATSERDPQIYIIDADQCSAECLGDEVFDEVYVCDLDARFYPAQGSHSALATLEKKIGCWSDDKPLEKRRRWFESLKARAHQRFVCERVLYAGGEEDVYPAFILEEFIECYRSGDDGLDALGLPARLRDAVVTRGEELFAANVAGDGQETALLQETVSSQDKVFLQEKATLQEQAAPLVLPALPEHALKPEARSVLFPAFSRAATYLQTTDDNTLVLSPSAIEAYVNCPYYWFVAQRVRPKALDEELGPLEKGTFAHAVWELFYERLFTEVGARRVTPGILTQAQGVLGQVFDECLAAQPEEPGTRYVPLTPTECAEAQRLKVQLQENLGLQARVMSDFVPTGAEISLMPRHNIRYAGVVLRGRVDRVDVNEQAHHYAVIDYKGSIAGHDAGCKEEDEIALPHKIQTLIYAQALRGQIGSCRPVGALYMSYQARDARDLVAGSYDESMLDLSRFAKRASAVSCNFETYLDRIETLVEQRLNDLREGCIEPRPLCADSCRHCPVAGCARRLS